MVANPYLREYFEGLSARYPADGADMSYAEWICANTKLGGRRFKFDGYEYQIQIANDLSRDLSVTKPSQVGATEFQVRKFLAFLARNRGTAGIFTLPNEKMYKKLSKARVKPLITSTQAFSLSGFGDKPTRSVDLYEIAGSHAYFAGLTEGEATSTPADILFHDELDLSDQTMIALYQSRLQNSDWKLTQKFSTPTHPGYGIDASYKISDQHEYLIRCEACNHHQIPEFNETFVVIPGFDHHKPLLELDESDLALYDVDNSYLRCEKCHRRLNLKDPTLREWVPRYPTRRQRGYRITPFSTHRRHVSHILDQLQTYRTNNNMRGFHNTVLGQAHSDGSNQLDIATIEKVMGGPGEAEIGSTVPCSIGIDVGKTCHVTVGPIRGDVVHHARFWLVPADDLVHFLLDEVMPVYNIVCGSIDRHPYTPTANAVMEATDGIILPVEYRGQKAINLVEDEFEVLSHAQANRTIMLDTFVATVRKKLTTISGYGQYKAMIEEHLQDMVRIEVDEKEARWEKLTGNDHFFHAMAFSQLGPKIREVIQFQKPDENPNVMIGFMRRNHDDTNAQRTLNFGTRTYRYGAL